jgi:hypothetical protein
MRPGDRIYREVTSWPGVTTGTGDFGEVEYYVRGRMIGHVHGDELADIPFPRALRDRLVAEGRTAPHHIHPDSGWTSRRIRGPADTDGIVQLLRINYDRVTSTGTSTGN